jgi:putative transposase
VLCAAAHNTYVSTWAGTVYTAFAIDVFSRKIVCWECSTSKEGAFLRRAIRQAVGYRHRQGHPLAEGAIHHSDYAESCVKPRDRVLACASGVV